MLRVIALMVGLAGAFAAEVPWLYQALPDEVLIEWQLRHAVGERRAWYVDPTLARATWPGRDLPAVDHDQLLRWCADAGFMMVETADGSWLHPPAGQGLAEDEALVAAGGEPAWAAAERLRRDGSPTAIAAILRAAWNEDATINTPAKRALKRWLGVPVAALDDSLQTAFHLLGHPDERIRAIAAPASEDFGRPQPWVALRALMAEDESTRSMVQVAAQRYGEHLAGDIPLLLCAAAAESDAAVESLRRWRDEPGSISGPSWAQNGNWMRRYVVDRLTRVHDAISGTVSPLPEGKRPAPASFDEAWPANAIGEQMEERDLRRARSAIEAFLDPGVASADPDRLLDLAASCPHPALREVAWRLLADLRDPERQQHLVDLYEAETHPQVRARAARSLAQAGGPIGRAALLVAFDSPDSVMDRSQASVALAKVRHPGLAQRLIERIPTAGDEEAVAAIQHLALTRSERAEPFLVDQLLAGDEARRQAAAVALTALPTPGSHDALSRVLLDASAPISVRRWCLQAFLPDNEREADRAYVVLRAAAQKIDHEELRALAIQGLQRVAITCLPGDDRAAVIADDCLTLAADGSAPSNLRRDALGIVQYVPASDAIRQRLRSILEAESNPVFKRFVQAALRQAGG